jgi:hypothetical protein
VCFLEIASTISESLVVSKFNKSINNSVLLTASPIFSPDSVVDKSLPSA